VQRNLVVNGAMLWLPPCQILSLNVGFKFPMSTHCSKPTGLEIDAPSLQPKLGPPWQSRQQGSQTGTKLISESQEALLRGSTFRVQLHAISESAFFNGISGALQTYQALIHIHPPHCGKVGDPPKAFCKMFFQWLASDDTGYSTFGYTIFSESWPLSIHVYPLKKVSRRGRTETVCSFCLPNSKAIRTSPTCIALSENMIPKNPWLIIIIIISTTKF